MTDATDDWAARLRSNRAEKDRFFAEHQQSPIPPADRDAFDGLVYFEPDPAYRVEATVTVHDDPEALELETTAGRTLRYHRTHTLTFELQGEERTLHSYRQEGRETETLFVPFRDKTTGQQTYDAGRYLELEIEGELADGETFSLDFNLAYAPFCAYSETFDCPLPPEENWLDVAIRAGEQTP